MQPLDSEAESLLREWIEKADADLEVARRMAAEADPCSPLSYSPDGSPQAASISSAWVVGCGIDSPSSRIPCKCRATASRMRRLVSSNVRPVAIHPGRSGTWALYPVLVLA